MSSLPEGTQIGAYRVGTLLGKGGMGAVYEATHSEINRKVAVKVLHARFAEKSEFKVRFTNEAKIANLVEHPGLVQIFDYGQLPDGAAYLVMEYLKGETLGSRIKRCGGILPLRDAIRMAHLIADSLEAAHSKGVLHRDTYNVYSVYLRNAQKPLQRRRKDHVDAIPECKSHILDAGCY